jgi:hypothetical protein
MTGNTVGDLWVTTDTGHGHVWEANSTWSDVGPIIGPPGPAGESAVSHFVNFVVPPIGGSAPVYLLEPSAWAAPGMTAWVNINEQYVGGFLITAVSADALTLTYQRVF